MIPLTSDQQQTSSELLEDNNSLALVYASEDDGDGSGGKAGPERSGMLAEELLRGTLSRTERQIKQLKIPTKTWHQNGTWQLVSEHEKLHL